MQALIKMKKVVCERFRRDDEGHITEINKALDGVSLEVQPGQFIAILGHNGSGKSTLARHINALLEPTEGTVWVNGKDTAKEENELGIRKTAGMVFQNPDNQIVASVVEEDVAFGPENIGVPTKEIWKRVEESLKNVEMYTYHSHNPNRLSGGQKQRIAIAGVMAMKPRCIILDEATAMLDPHGRKDVLETARRLNREEGITIIWITHYMEEVTQADRIFVMENGKIAMEGTPKEIFVQTKKLEQCQLTIPETTRLVLELEKRGISIPKDILDEEELITYLISGAGKM